MYIHFDILFFIFQVYLFLNNGRLIKLNAELNSVIDFNLWNKCKNSIYYSGLKKKNNKFRWISSN